MRARGGGGVGAGGAGMDTTMPASRPRGPGAKQCVCVPEAGSDCSFFKMARWSEQKTAHFIACYKEHECLWNPQSFFYNSYAARENAYAELLEHFNDDNLTLQLLKSKIKNIRTAYHHELNKIKYSLKSGSALYKPSLCWFDALDSFLGEIIRKETTKTIPSRKFKNFKRKLVSSDRTDLNASSQTLSDDKLEYTLEVHPLTNDQEPCARKHVRLLTNKSMTGQYDETDSEKSGTPDRLENPSTTPNKPSQCEDEFYFFGMNVAAQLRRLPLDTALRLQSEFQNTLFLARVRSQSSSGPDLEETIIQTTEDTKSESIEQDVSEKEFPIDINTSIELPLESPLPHENEINDSIFKKAWDAS